MAISKAVRSAHRQKAVWAILFCFFASGMSGLIYQVVWVRELVLVFGATTFAVSTVLTAFMGGLALGSYYFGRRSGSIKRPLKVYGLLEIGIGLYGLTIPLIFAVLPSLYHPFWRWLHLSFFALSVVRFLFAALVLILPTALMGATLPVLSHYYAREQSRVGLRVGSLYALNTFGAVCGAAITGFILIPMLGMTATTATAAALNIILGMVALWAARLDQTDSRSEASNLAQEQKSESGAALKAAAKAASHKKAAAKAAAAKAGDRAKPVAVGRAGVIVVLVGFALSGFVALSYEVIWSRVLALIIGSSVYAFSIMLTTFLIGLALGSTLAARMVDRIRRPLVAFALVELGVGAASLIGAYLFNDLPYVFVQLYSVFKNSAFGILLFARFLVASLVMFFPTLLLGALFPLVIRIVSENTESRSTGRTVGDVYAANTLGSIAGSFASGFILIPWLGLLGSLKACVALNFVIAAALFLMARGEREMSRSHKRGERRGALRVFALVPTRLRAATGIAASIVLMAAVILASPPWDSDVMSSAVYRYAPSMSHMSRQDFLDYIKQGQGETIFYEEGITATVAVQELNGSRVLKVNGKPEASTAGDMPTQVLIGTLPLLVRKNTADVLLIGLGSGVTLGSIQQFPVSRVTCVELEPAVIKASHHFNDVNNNPLADERLRLINNDGRNFIYTTEEKFDVIVSEPSNPWLTGVANLFTIEYFKRGAERLKEGGLFCQWLQIYEMTPEEVRTLMATFRAAFPHVYLFRGAEGDLMLLGSKGEQRLDLSVINSHFDDPKIAADHKRVNTNSAADLISRFYLGPQEITEFTAGATLNTDDNALIEFSAPRRVGTTEHTVESNLNHLLARAASPLPYIDSGTRDEANFLLDASLAAIKRSDTARAEQFVNYSIELADTARAHSILGELHFARNDESGAIGEWQTALQIDPDHFFTLVNLGKLYLMKQDVPRAVPYLDRAIEINPASARAHHLRGLAYQASSDYAKAAQSYRRALPDAEYTRGVATFYLNFGTALINIGLYEEAAQMLEQYTALAPGDAEGFYQLGAAYEIISERTLDDDMARRAVEQLKRALKIQPNHPMAHYYLSKAYRRLEMYEEAEAEFEIYERLTP